MPGGAKADQPVLAPWHLIAFTRVKSSLSGDVFVESLSEQVDAANAR
jgi:hypothetical protein